MNGRFGLNELRNDRVSCLVICGKALFLFGNYLGMLCGADDDLYHRLLHIGHTDKSFSFSCSKKRRFVKEIFKIGSREADCCFCDCFKAYVSFEGFAASVNLEDSLSALDIGVIDRDFAVESARTKESGVKDIGTVCRCHNDNAVIRAEAVHLNEELVKRLLSFIVTAAETCASVTSHSVDFVYKDDTCGVFLCGFEKVTHTRRAHTYVHFDKVRTRNREEGNSRFSCNRFRKQRFTCTGRAYEQYTMRNSRTELSEMRGISEKLNDFAKLFFFLVGTSYVLKSHFISVICNKSRTASAKVTYLRAFSSRLTHHKDPREDEKSDHDKIRQEAYPPRDFRRRREVIRLDNTFLILFRDKIVQIRIKQGQIAQLIFDVTDADASVRKFLANFHSQKIVAVNNELNNFFIMEIVKDFTVCYAVIRRAVEKRRCRNDDHCDKRNIEQNYFKVVFFHS